MGFKNRINLSDRQKIRILLEMDQEICSIDPEFPKGSIRKYVNELKKYMIIQFIENHVIVILRQRVH